MTQARCIPSLRQAIAAGVDPNNYVALVLVKGHDNGAILYKIKQDNLRSFISHAD
jgi:hypothetical protein